GWRRGRGSSSEHSGRGALPRPASNPTPYQVTEPPRRAPGARIRARSAAQLYPAGRVRQDTPPQLVDPLFMPPPPRVVSSLSPPPRRRTSPPPLRGPVGQVQDQVPPADPFRPDLKPPPPQRAAARGTPAPPGAPRDPVPAGTQLPPRPRGRGGGAGRRAPRAAG